MSEQTEAGKINALMADNQVAFRKLNSKLKILIHELDEIAVERGEKKHVFDKDEIYHFYCECSDENCVARIAISFETYEKAHERDDTFTILQGHEVLEIEEIISKTTDYYVVQKFETPKQSNTTLHETALKNAVR